MKYIYFSDGTDNGKPFNSLEEAIEYLYQQAHHSKVHLDGVLKDMKVTEDAFILYIEKYSKLRELHPQTIMNCLEEYILSI